MRWMDWLIKHAHAILNCTDTYMWVAKSTNCLYVSFLCVCKYMYWFILVVSWLGIAQDQADPGLFWSYWYGLLLQADQNSNLK